MLFRQSSMGYWIIYARKSFYILNLSVADVLSKSFDFAHDFEVCIFAFWPTQDIGSEPMRVFE